MATSHFQRELLPPAKSFYERELGKLTRPARGWSRGNCPFHKSKSGTSFSVNLESGGFHCFGCDAKGGDVLAFVMLRDRLSFKAAAQSLGAWRDVSSAERVQLDAAKARREREAVQAAEAKEAERRERIRLRGEMHTAHEIWQRACSRLSELRRGEVPTSDTEAEDCWAVMSLALPYLRETETEYCKLAGLDSPE